jgi:hypothetical protein
MSKDGSYLLLAKLRQNGGFKSNGREGGGQ